MDQSVSSKDLFKLTMQVTSAYLAKNKSPLEKLPEIINTIFIGLANAQNNIFERLPSNPAVPISESVTDDYIICLEDGKKLQMLKRHLGTVYKMAVAEYKQRWGLSSNYPVVAPNYAKRRSQIAKEIKLGTSSHRRRIA